MKAAIIKDQYTLSRAEEETETSMIKLIEIRMVLTVLETVKIYISIAEGDIADLVPANPNGGHRRDLAKEIVQLSLVDGEIKVPDVQRRPAERPALRLRRRYLQR